MGVVGGAFESTSMEEYQTQTHRDRELLFEANFRGTVVVQMDSPLISGAADHKHFRYRSAIGQSVNRIRDSGPIPTF